MTREDLEGNSGVGLCSDTCVGAASEATRSSGFTSGAQGLGSAVCRATQMSVGSKALRERGVLPACLQTETGPGVAAGHAVSGEP